MKKALKKSLSVFLAVAIIFSSGFIGLNELDFSVFFEVEAKAAEDSNKDFNEVMYVEQESITCDGKMTYVVYLKGGIKVSGVIVNVEFDDKSLRVYDGGAYTVIDEYGDFVPVIPGIYEYGFRWNSTNMCSIGYVNTSPSTYMKDTPFLKITFNVDNGYNVADVKFTCIEFSCENEDFNVTKAEEPVVLFEEKTDITIAEHISSDWIRYEASVYSAGLKYRECNVCGEIIENIILPQLICEKPDLLGVFLDEIGLVFGWSSVKGADSYAVYRKTISTDWVFLDEVEYNTTTYLDTNVEEGVLYYYTVRAINEAGASIYNIEGVSGEYHIHKFGAWETTIPVTCTTAGKQVRVCFCGEEEIFIIEPEGHEYSTEWTIDVEPTCKQEGSKSHHCIYCGDRADITAIMTTDHNYELKVIEDAHPHTALYQCSYCGATKTEETTVSDCLECNFIVTYVQETNSYKLVSYIGTATDVVIPAKYNGGAITEIYRSCFKDNTSITSVKIPEGVTTIDTIAFMNCSSLERVFIPASVTTIGNNAFYGASDELIIFCYRGSAAREYAIENDIDYVLMDNIETEDTLIDYENSLIFTSIQGCDDPTEFWIASGTADVVATPSLVYGNLERYGTGTILTVFDGGKYIGDFTLIVEGDLNGDSVCDVLDAAVAHLYSVGLDEPTQNEIYAANGCISDVIDVNAYQEVVNIVSAG